MNHRILALLVLGVTIPPTLVSARPLGALPAERTGTGSTVWHIVALGDSDTTGHGDPTRLGWVGRYARLLRQNRGLQVRLTNLAQDGETSAVLLREVRSDPATRTAIKEAQIVLLGIGGADLNPGDARMQAGRCKAEACYAPDLQAFGRHFEATVKQVRALRTSGQAVLRAITLPNALTGAEDVIPSFLKPVATRIGVYQAKTLKGLICGAMNRHAGRCIDVLRAFNGPSGTEDAYKKGLMNKVDCCYPSAKGQQLMAQLLFNTGLAPLR